MTNEEIKQQNMETYRVLCRMYYRNIGNGLEVMMKMFELSNILRNVFEVTWEELESIEEQVKRSLA